MTTEIQSTDMAEIQVENGDVENILQLQYDSEESRLVDLRAAIGTKVMAGENFDAEAAELASLNVTHADTRKLNNSRAIADETAQILAAFKTIIDSSRLTELLGEPVISAVYLVESGTGENGPVTSLNFNQKVARRAAIKSGPDATITRGKKFQLPDGTIISGRDVVLNYADESVLSAPLVKHGEGKWITKPMYLDAAIASAAAAGVVLTEVN